MQTINSGIEIIMIHFSLVEIDINFLLVLSLLVVCYLEGRGHFAWRSS